MTSSISNPLLSNVELTLHNEIWNRINTLGFASTGSYEERELCMLAGLEKFKEFGDTAYNYSMNYVKMHEIDERSRISAGIFRQVHKDGVYFLYNRAMRIMKNWQDALEDTRFVNGRVVDRQKDNTFIYTVTRDLILKYLEKYCKDWWTPEYAGRIFTKLLREQDPLRKMR